MLPKHVFICKGALPRLPNGKTDYVRVGLPFKDEHSPAYPYFAQVNRRSVLSTNVFFIPHYYTYPKPTTEVLRNREKPKTIQTLGHWSFASGRVDTGFGSSRRFDHF
eukprot:1387921-Amorphochlora_amoeboformis.AAC.1